MIRPRHIVHIDMDAFFASVEERDNPAIKGRAVIVGADPKGGKARGVVSACSYEARKFGIHSAMPISIAYRMCPHAVFLPVDMEKYSAVSGEIYEMLYDFTPDIEPVSIDEAFMDITASCHLFGTPRETCMLIKERIKKDTALTASIGLAPNKMAAKIASDLKKPDGMVEVLREGLLDFLRPLDIRRIWGLGAKSEKILKDLGINTIGELAVRDAGELTALFGRNGFHLWQLANGIDESEVEPRAEAKSISNETTFERDISDREKIESALIALSEKVSARLRDESLKGRTITLKIRLEGFHTYTRSVTMPKSTNYVDVIYREVKSLYGNFDTSGKKVRLVGVKVSNLIPLSVQDSLFKENGEEKMERVHSVVDRIRGRFGDKSIHRAGGI